MDKDLARAADRAALRNDIRAANALARMAGIQDQFGQYPKSRLRHLQAKQERKNRALFAVCFIAVLYALFQYL